MRLDEEDNEGGDDGVQRTLKLSDSGRGEA